MAHVATFRGRAATEHLDTLKASLASLAQESVAQPGTIRYEFYQAETDPHVIMLLAIWETEADWRAHIASDAHKRHEASLPAGAWEQSPTRVVWQELRA